MHVQPYRQGHYHIPGLSGSGVMPIHGVGAGIRLYLFRMWLFGHDGCILEPFVAHKTD
jgi:hypothetical protein